MCLIIQKIENLAFIIIQQLQVHVYIYTCTTYKFEQVKMLSNAYIVHVLMFQIYNWNLNCHHFNFVIKLSFDWQFDLNPWWAHWTTVDAAGLIKYWVLFNPLEWCWSENNSSVFHCWIHIKLVIEHLIQQNSVCLFDCFSHNFCHPIFVSHNLSIWLPFISSQDELLFIVILYMILFLI